MMPNADPQPLFADEGLALPVRRVASSETDLEIVTLDVNTSNTANILTDPRMYAMLSSQEREAIGRLRRPADRMMRTASRLLLRFVLGNRYGISPSSVPLVASAAGAPILNHPLLSRTSFSVARPPGMVIAIFSDGRQVGVDLETPDRMRRVIGDQGSWRTAAEAACDRCLSKAEHDMASLRRWTLKEAYLKARGVGLLLAPDLIGFDLAKGRAMLSVAPAIERRPQDWRFVYIDPAPGFTGAIALRRPLA